jgi:predicted DNA binding CopG/RHH family protein
MKNERLELRLSSKDYELIKQIALKKGLTVSKMILSVVISYCLKNKV